MPSKKLYSVNMNSSHKSPTVKLKITIFLVIFIDFSAWCVLTWLRGNFHLVEGKMNSVIRLPVGQCKFLFLSGFRPWLLFAVGLLGPCYAIWRHRAWSTLVQVMDWCLLAPIHYLNKCCIIIILGTVAFTSRQFYLECSREKVWKWHIYGYNCFSQEPIN